MATPTDDFTHAGRDLFGRIELAGVGLPDALLDLGQLQEILVDEEL